MKQTTILVASVFTCFSLMVGARDFPVAVKTGAAIQQAIDAAAAEGGGRVVVPAGEYPSGSIRLRSKVELHLEKGAVVKGGTRSEDYFSFPEDVCLVKPEGSARVFVYAWEESDFAITGEGVIDGQGPAFFDHSTFKWGFWAKPPHERPRMVQFVRCRDVRLEGVTFLDSPGWTMLIRLCSNVEAKNINVFANQKMINSDGIDFDGCSHVRVSGCRFKTGDDCIIMRAMREAGSDEKIVTEDVVVEDCDLDSACQAVRMGCPSDDTIRNITFRNIRASGNNGVYFNYPTRYLRPDDEGYMNIHDVLFENFTGEFRGSAVQIDVDPGVKLRGVRNIAFRNFDVKSKRPLRFVGNVHSKFENVIFSNVVVNGVRQPDGAVPADFSNAGPLVRPKPVSWETKRSMLERKSVSKTTDVFIGSAGLGHVTPAAAYPFGMVQAGPDTSAKPDHFAGDWPHTGGYQHTDGWLWRFSQTHISGTGCPSLGDFGVLPYVDGFDGVTKPAKIVKETERAMPGSYAVTIDENGARVACEVSALARSAVYRFTFPAGKKAKLLFDLDWGMSSPGGGESCWGRYVRSSPCSFPDARSLRASRRVFLWNDYAIHCAVEFSAPVVGRVQTRVGNGVRGDVYTLDFGEIPGGVLEMRIGLSPNSSESAAANLASETKGQSFAQVAAKATAGWDALLSRVELDASTPKDTAASFRAALYRTLFQPNDWSDAGEAPYFTTLSLWDTFRAAHPLYTLVAPERVTGFVTSMLRQCDEQGYLPIWAVGRSDNHCMIGHHAVPVIADAYLKGVKGVDWEKAFRAVKQSLTVNHHPVGDGTWGLMKEDWDLLDKYGYYPWDKMRGGYRRQVLRGESVARTLECAYDDACAARFASALGKTSDAAFFAKRAGSWKNVFDPAIGFMRGKGADGKWREPFDPIALGGGPWTDNDFCEGNSWQYTWHVMQDPEGLVAAFGGKDKFGAKLEELFTLAPRDYKERPTSDVTGLIGQYAHGNEPSHHTVYFFQYAGRPDLTAKYVRAVFDTQYFARPDGLCGNDDCGQMAAWYVFSALGFYPFDPCGGDYVLGAPQVPSATLRLPNGKTFRIVAKNFSKENLYVKSVTLNGCPLAGFILKHADILAGGELVFEMSARP